MDPFVAAALRLAPMGKKAFDRYRASKVSQTLDRLVRADLTRDDTLAPRTAQNLDDEWRHVHDDPQAAAIVERLLHDRDVRYLDALEIHINKLLAGLELLPFPPETVAARLVQAVRNSYIAAQPDDRQATQAAATATLTAIEDLPQRSDFAKLADTVTRAAGRPAPLLILPGDVSADEERLLAEARQEDKDAAAEVARLLKAGGHARLAQYVTGNEPRVDDQSPVFWQCAGRILGLHRDLRSAQAAFERRAAHEEVPDRVDALVGAARCAWLDGRTDDADAQLADPAVTAQPDHPALVLLEAERTTDDERRLELVDSVTPRTDRERGRAAALRATALVNLGRYEEARTAAAESTAADPHATGPEIAAAVEIERARTSAERERDDRPLLDAIAYFERLAAEADVAGDAPLAGLARARAAVGHGVIGDRALVAAKIDEVLEMPGALDWPLARWMLLNAAIGLEDGARAERIVVEAPDTPEGRFQRVIARLQSGSDVASVVADLDALIAELDDGPLQVEARRMRLNAAEDPSVPLDDSIAEGLEDAELELAHVHAIRELRSGNAAGARAVLAGRTDPTSLALQRDIALDEERADDAIRWQTTLARRRPTAVNQLRLAAMHGQNGAFREAFEAAWSVATDDRRAPGLRVNAYAIAAQSAADGRDWERLEDVTDRWRELAPADTDAPWFDALALARQGRHDEALARLDAAQTKPDTSGRRLLYAELVSQGVADPGERLRRLADLSEDAGRPEELEHAFVVSVLQTPDADRPQDPELLARFHETLEQLPTAGSGIVAIRSHTVDLEKDDPEQLIRQLAAMTPKADPAGEQTRIETQEGVRRGEQPIAMLAALTGRSLSEIIVRNGARPLSVFDADTFDRETSDARTALDAGAAVLDETACITLGELGPALADPLLALLPGALIGQPTHDCLTRALASRPAGKHVAIMHVDADGRPQIFEEDPVTVDRIRAAEGAAVAAAAWASVVPEPAPTTGDDLDRLLATTGRRSNLEAMICTLAVARDQHLPVYSDDRVVRALARGFGLQAFGTLALIDAAHDADLISDDAENSSAMAVLGLGVWSAALPAELYVELARRTDWDVRRIGRALLADEVLLRTNPRIVHNAALLICVAGEAPGKLDDWATAIISSYVDILGSNRVKAVALLTAVIDAIHEEGNCDEERATAAKQALDRVDLADG